MTGFSPKGHITETSELPFKPGEWVYHRHLGEVLLREVSLEKVIVITKNGDDIRMTLQRAFYMLTPMPRGMSSRKSLLPLQRFQVNPRGSLWGTPGKTQDITEHRTVTEHPIEFRNHGKSFVLRPYQADALKALSECFSKHNSGILALPTGSGKTFVAAKWIWENFLRLGKKVIWIAHRIELLEQAYVTFAKLLPPSMSQSITWWAGGKPKNPYGALVLVSIMAARNFPAIHTDLLVIDEAHHEPAQIYRFFQNHINFDKHLGLTATPKRLDEKRLGYESIAYQKTFISLVSEGWLAQPLPVIPKTKMNFLLERRMDDFSDESLAKLDTDERNEFIAEHWSANADRYGKTLVFALNRAHARRLSKAFSSKRPDKKIAYIVSGEGTQDERFQKVLKFRNGEIDVLINCRIFTEGFDCPDVKTIMITRPTLSTTLYLQMIGRGTRVTPNKRSFYLVDFEDDLGRFQSDLIRPWDLGRESEEEQFENKQYVFVKEEKEYNKLPNWLKKKIKVSPVELSLIAGYVTYTLEDGKEDGFLVYKEDENDFLKIWLRLEKESSISKPIQLRYLARCYFSELNTKRLPLVGLCCAAIALAKNNAKYVSFTKQNLLYQIMEFLHDIEINEEELSNIINAVDKFMRL